MTGNTISSNGEEGVFFQGDTNMRQSRVTYLRNFPFPDPPFNPADDRPQTFGFYTPTQPELPEPQRRHDQRKYGVLAHGSGRCTWIPEPTNSSEHRDADYGQHHPEQWCEHGQRVKDWFCESELRPTLRRPSTTTRSGATLKKTFEQSPFLSFGNTFNSIDNSGDGTFDVIYWDDTAQLDMTFQNNTGNQIILSSDGATYTNNDFLKSRALGGFNSLPPFLFGVRDRRCRLLPGRRWTEPG